MQVTPLEVELNVCDVVSGVDGLRDDVPLEELPAVDVTAVRVSDHHPENVRQKYRH